METTYYLKKAINLYKNRNYEEAFLLFKNIIKRYYKYSDISKSEYLESNMYLGKIILRDKTKTIEDATKYFYPVLKEGSVYQKEQVYFELATKYRLDKIPLKAIILYETCLLMVPSDTYVMTDLANMYLSRNSLEEASRYFQKILEVAFNMKGKLKRQIALNTAYIGLARIAVKKDNKKEALMYLEQVNPTTISDYEQLEMVYSCIYFQEGLLDEALNFLETNVHSRIDYIKYRSLAKSGIIYALKDNHKTSLEYLKDSYDPYDNIALGALYLKTKEYDKACNSYFLAARIDQNYLVKALECAMYFDEVLAIKIVNNLLDTSVPKEKYFSIILYLSKKYNIFFTGVSYETLNSYNEALISPSLEKALEDLKISNKLNQKLGSATILIESTVKMLLNTNEVKTTKIEGPITDKYYLYLPFIGWNLEDYLVVETLKNTKEVVRIDLAKECFSEVKTSMILKKDKNISKIFK